MESLISFSFTIIVFAFALLCDMMVPWYLESARGLCVFSENGMKATAFSEVALGGQKSCIRAVFWIL